MHPFSYTYVGFAVNFRCTDAGELERPAFAGLPSLCPQLVKADVVHCPLPELNAPAAALRRNEAIAVKRRYSVDAE